MDNMAMNEGKKNSKIWIWVVMIVLVLMIFFFTFRGPKEGTIQKNVGSQQQNQVTGQGGIDSLDVGDNPDIGMDDFNSLQVSQEEIVSS